MVIASLPNAISAYKRLHRNVLLSDSRGNLPLDSFNSKGNGELNRAFSRGVTWPDLAVGEVTKTSVAQGIALHFSEFHTFIQSLTHSFNT